MSIKQVQIQSILLPNSDICNEKDLYFHHKNDTRIDFNGYFNLFYIEKRKKYTNLENVSLSLELQGFTKLILVYNGSDIKTFALNADIALLCRTLNIKLAYFGLPLYEILPAIKLLFPVSIWESWKKIIFAIFIFALTSALTAENYTSAKI